jgi:AraC family transcriptional regulator
MSMNSGLNFVSQLFGSDVRFDEHDGPLSIKCAFGGQEMYEIEGGRLAVDDSGYLVLNNRQRYASSINQLSPIESFCIWFRPGFAEQILGALKTEDDRLLDNPAFISKQPVTFFDRVYAHDDVVSPVMFEMRRRINDGHATDLWLEEQFHVLLQRLLQVHRGIYHDVERLPAARWSTRLELYRRLHRARDFMDCSLHVPISLSQMANVASLSPHHFLRLFKKSFHETPGQYMSRRRMERAQTLLAGTDLPVTQICMDLGFESLGSFSWLFRQRFGLPPSRYRAEAIASNLTKKINLREADIAGSLYNGFSHGDTKARLASH